MLIIFAIQHRGISETASVQKWLAIIVLVPLLIIGVYPIVSGQIVSSNVTGLLPPTAAYAATDGTLEQRWLDALPRRPLYCRLVDLRF